MKRFTGNFVLFLGILIFFNVSLSFTLVQRPLYGNPVIEKKFEIVKKNIDDYDVFIWGSSRIATGVNPVSFDSVMKKEGIETKSYNMASYGTWFNETNYLIEKFLNEINGENKIMFIEMQSVTSVKYDRLTTDRNIYYQNSFNLNFVLNYIKDHRIESLNDILKVTHLLGEYGISQTFNLMNLGKSHIFNNVPKKYDFNIDNGFKSLIGQMEDDPPYRFSQLRNEMASSEEYFNAAMLNKILKLIERAETSNIKLIYILNAKNYTPEMISVFDLIPDENKLSFFLTEEMFLKKYWADETHLNRKGAELYTSHLVKTFIEEIHK